MQVHFSKRVRMSFGSWQSSGEVLPRIRSNESCLVSMVSVLDVLGQPVLGPVNLFTTNRNSEILKYDPELVVLHLVVNTVEPGNCTKSLLLILKVVPDSLLEYSEVVSILWILRDRKDLGKQNIMLLIKSGIISSKAFIPNIWLGYNMLKMSPVAKVSVLDMLNKPILSPLHFLMADWCSQLGKTFTEQNMLLLVFLAVVPGQIN